MFHSLQLHEQLFYKSARLTPHILLGFMFTKKLSPTKHQLFQSHIRELRCIQPYL